MPDFSCPALLRCRPDQDAGFRLQASHLLRGRFPAPSPNLRPRRADGPSTPRVASPRPRFGLLRFRSPLLPQSLLFSLPPGTEMFQFPGFAPPIRAVPPSDGGGLPHSDIRASQDICSSARLFAACHVLPRLREPRHPSCALVSFPCSFKKRRLSLFLVHRPALTQAGALFDLLVFLLPAVLLSARPVSFHHVNVLFFRWRITDSNR